MATTSAATAARNARLDALVSATNAWADLRTAELKRRVASAKRILSGRTGSERLAQNTTAAVSDLVVSQIADFLVSK